MTICLEEKLFMRVVVYHDMAGVVNFVKLFILI